MNDDDLFPSIISALGFVLTIMNNTINPKKSVFLPFFNKMTLKKNVFDAEVDKTQKVPTFK